MGTSLLSPQSTMGDRPRVQPSIGQETGRNADGGARRHDESPPIARAPNQEWRDRLLRRWIEAADRLHQLKPRWRGCYETLVDAVCVRLRVYRSVDLLVTSYFQSTDFATEAIRARYPTLPHPWDVRLIEDVAWGRRLKELTESSAGKRSREDPAPAARPPEMPDEAREGARRAAEDDWSGARRAYQAAVNASPNVADYWQQLGIACGRLGDWRWAQDAFERASRLGPTPDTTTLLGEVRAIRRLTRQLRDRPFDAALHTRLGTLLMAWEHGDQALEHLRRAIDLAPAWATPRIHLGLEYHYRQDWEAAEHCYRAARELGSDEASLDLLIAACEARDLPSQRGPEVVPYRDEGMLSTGG